MTQQLTQAIVEQIADWQHLDTVRISPSRWDAYNWHGDKVGEIYAMPANEEPER